MHISYVHSTATPTGVEESGNSNCVHGRHSTLSRHTQVLREIYMASDSEDCLLRWPSTFATLTKCPSLSVYSVYLKTNDKMLKNMSKIEALSGAGIVDGYCDFLSFLLLLCLIFMICIYTNVKRVAVLYFHNISSKPKYRTQFRPTLEHQASGMLILPTFFFFLYIQLCIHIEQKTCLTFTSMLCNMLDQLQFHF